MCNPISKKLSQSLSKYYTSCQALPLKVFCDIVNSHNYRKLKRFGLFTNSEYELEIWSELLIEYSELEGDATAKDRIDKVKYLNELKNTYTVLKAMIRFCWICAPGQHGKHEQVIKDLKKMGYKIDCSSSKKYRDSLLLADRRVNALVTMIRMKTNELEDKGDESNINYDDLMALIQAYYNVGDNITVARYISMKKSIMQRQKSSEKLQQNKGMI